MKHQRPRVGAAVILTALLLQLVLVAPAHAAAPSNDEFGDATVIPSVPFSQTIDTTDATASVDDPDGCLSYWGKSVWYAYTADDETRIVANTFGSDYDTVLAVFEGAATDDDRIVCSDDWKSISQSRASFDVEPGQTYYFLVSGQGGQLTFNLEIALPPKNDEIENAVKVPVKLPWTFRGDTSEATLNVDDPSCAGKSRSVWFRYERPKKWTERRIEMTTSGSDYDTTLSLYVGKPGRFDQIKCEDDSGGPRSRVRFVAEPGETYWVMVGSANNSSGGSLRFKVKQPPIPFRWSIGIGAKGSVSDATGTATVGGSVTCSRKARIELSVSIRQKDGDRVIWASTRKNFTCEKSRTWSVNLAAGRPFKPALAGVWVKATVPAEDRSKNPKRVVELDTCSQCL